MPPGLRQTRRQSLPKAGRPGGGIEAPDAAGQGGLPGVTAGATRWRYCSWGARALVVAVLVGSLPAFALPAAPNPAAPTHDDVADVLRQRCVGCHVEGGPAPFALRTYSQARAWSAAIRRAVAAGTMPPWHADPLHGSFANDRRLSPDEKAALLAWVDGGALPGAGTAAGAEGEETNGSAPTDGEPAVGAAPSAEPANGAPAPAGAWSIGAPDLVFELPEDVTIPAGGEVPYHGYRVETNLAEDLWVQAAETLPGNRAVVHHVIVQVVPGAAGPLPGAAGDPRTAGDLGGYAPGTGPLVMPPGVGRRLPAGSALDFQMHYTPTGQVETDRSRIGLVLAEAPPRHESLTALCSTPFLWIPAGERDVRFEAEVAFPGPVRILSLRPHMHLRGDTFEFRAEYPDGRSETLLLVRGYDFDWQTTYRLAEPVDLPAGARLACTASYDNSDANLDNPDPGRDVSWGRETTDEMMIGFVEYHELE